jgi:hypothetical protein
MQSIEHRHVPRTKLDKLAYIGIDPNNGGIVLNVSREGLGFHSIVPVERNAPLRFSLQEQNRKIDVSGELVWTDGIQKTGGLRFTALTSEAQDQIGEWISKSESVVEECSSRHLGSAFLRALPGPSTSRFSLSGSPKSHFTTTLGCIKARVQLKLTGFSGGLATGVLVSALAASVIVFFYGHRRQFGESLIRIGERLAANRDSDSLTKSSTSRAVGSPLFPANESTPRAGVKPEPAKMMALVHTPASVHSGMPVRAPTSLTQEIPIQHATELQTEHKADPVKPPEPKFQASAPTQPVSQAGGPSAWLQASVPSNADPPSVSPVRTSVLPPPSATKADSGVTPTHSELAGIIHGRVLPANSDSSLQMFFDLGRFNQEQSAISMSKRLKQLGFLTSVIRRGHLWMSSYQVLVGPYNNEEAEKKMNDDLLSLGYKPRPFETGSRDFAFRSRVTIDHSKLPIGDLVISWESYVADAKVKFTQGHEVVVTADGKWVKSSRKYSQDEYVYQKYGSRPLLEIHFAGLNRALVFRNVP